MPREVAYRRGTLVVIEGYEDPTAPTVDDVFNADLGCSMRSTFIVDRDGVLRWQVDSALPDARSLADYAQVLSGL